MFERILLFVAFAGSIVILAISCNQRGSTTETPISAQRQTDSVVVETVVAEESPEPDEPPIETSALMASSFDFFRQPITDDAREDSILHALEQIINQFNKEGFVTINMTYTHADPVTPGIVREEGTWYYNADRQLCAASKTYHSDRTSMNSHYLCSDNDLVAMVSDSDFYDEGAGYSNSVRIVTTECPLCGVNLSNDDESGYEVSEIELSSLDKYAVDFFNEHEDLLKTFKEVTQLTKQGDRYIALVTVNSNPGMDTIKYSIDPNLIHKFFKKGLIQN